ncbi:hypothetical protein DXM32_06960 [Salmonella enterica]|nr:hypothetical protein [Salmonella enterica]EBJ6267037.1 hypothetical protein [Salmonella enterica]EBK9380197.1 hypothetical protein [Salmonella enterica]EBL0901253.1 hypothetical protein [Salmonella enterica]EBL0901573.1 hypothetical protein [Salmonella enterica]
MGGGTEQDNNERPVYFRSTNNVVQRGKYPSDKASDKVSESEYFHSQRQKECDGNNQGTKR